MEFLVIDRDKTTKIERPLGLNIDNIYNMDCVEGMRKLDNDSIDAVITSPPYDTMLTADKIQWSLGATIGRKFSKQFALNKQAQRVDYTEGQEPAVPSGDDNSQTGGGGTTGGELEG